MVPRGGKTVHAVCGTTVQKGECDGKKILTGGQYQKNMIKVCDAIMGNGKTSAAITYLNEHKDQKFIFITPYLEEAARIKESCPDLNFVEPSNGLKEYGFRKSLHTAALIEKGKNIATTHQAFKGYTPEELERIREHGYTLIIDENVDILEKLTINQNDLQLLVDAGYLVNDNNVYSMTEKQYSGAAFKDLFYLLQARNLIRVGDSGGDAYLYYWMLSPALITSFRDVFILTYLFEGQSLHHLLQIYEIPYEPIGIHRDQDGTFRFGPWPGYTPEYVNHIKDMIHILDNKKMNQIGDEYYALSKNWFMAGGENVDALKRNVVNCYRHIYRDTPADERLWGSYNDAFSKIRGKGYTKRFLTFNAKATNKYRNCSALVYIANIFMNTNERQFYKTHGIDADQDLYALSIMIQWIWRSAIRDGKEVRIYIPSKRMRTLLQDWMNSFNEGGNENG